jgi:hypothetical protein
MPINIQGVKNVQQKFYSSLVETSNSLALSQLWLVKMDRGSLLNIAEECGRSLDDYEGYIKHWDIFRNVEDTIRTSWFVGETFYMLAQSAVFPGDGVSVSRSGVEQTGMLKGIICDTRSDLSDVTITFLETNQSVADLFFRPWMLLVAHKSLKDQRFRTDIELVCFQKGKVLEDLRMRKSIKLIAAVPTTIDNEELNYTAGKVIERQITFTYNTYNVEADAIVDNVIGIGKRDFDEVANQKQDSIDKVANIQNPLRIKNVPKIRWDTEFDNRNIFKVDQPFTFKPARKVFRDFSKEQMQPSPKLSTAFKTTKDKKNIFLIEEPRIGAKGPGAKKKSLLEMLRDGLQKANQIFNNIKGKAERLRSQVSGGLRLIGQDKLANKVDKGYNKFVKKVQTPIGKVIGTGNRVNEATRRAQEFGKEITTLPGRNNSIQTVKRPVNIIPGPGSIF